MNSNRIGGGEILDYIGEYTDLGPSRIDDQLVRLFKMVPLVKILVYFLIVLVAIRIIMRMFNVRHLTRGKGMKSEMGHIEAVKKRDAAVLRANQFMRRATKIVEKSPFAMSKTHKEYWQYNIDRAGIKIPGGHRNMRAEELHALVQIATAIILAFAVIVLLLFNTILGWVLILFTIIISNTVPKAVLRGIVKDKDMEIKENFMDFYLMIHYVLIANASTPLTGVIKSYAKTTNSKEMHRFVDVCIHYMETYGEFEATRYIAKDYREIHEVNKLMRLIRQANEGGNVETELMGFRAEIIKAKRYEISKKVDRLVNKARLSFNILMPILIQAVLSAMSIYLSDMGLVRSLIGK